jgi:hypothetical protein
MAQIWKSKEEWTQIWEYKVSSVIRHGSESEAEISSEAVILYITDT